MAGMFFRKKGLLATAALGIAAMVFLGSIGLARAQSMQDLKRITGLITSVQTEGWFYDRDGTNTLIMRSTGKKYTIYTSDITVYTGSMTPRAGDRVVAEIVPYKGNWLARRIIYNGR